MPFPLESAADLDEVWASVTRLSRGDSRQLLSRIEQRLEQIP